MTKVKAAGFNAFLVGGTEDKTAATVAGDVDGDGTVSVSDARTIVDCGSCGDNMTYTLDCNGLLKINRTGKMWNFSPLEAPWLGNDIADVKTAIISDGITSIGDFAFCYCTILTDITMPDSITSIGTYAFSTCNLTNVIIPENVETIEEGAFENCGNITSINIPKSVLSIATYALDIYSLESITVDKDNTAYHSAGNCLIETKTKTLITGCKNSVIPTDGSVTSIGESAFDGNANFIDLTIPDSVTYIGNYAFRSCYELTSLTIPNSVTYIGDYAFAYCDNLETVLIPDNGIIFGEKTFYDCPNIVFIKGNKTLYIGDTVEFGSYPQTEVKDKRLKTKLNNKAGSTDNWTNYNYYQNGEKSDFMKYTDIELDGEKYRGVYFTSYRPCYPSGDGEYNYQDDNGYNTSTIYWFKYEPIIWKMLSYNLTTGTAVLLSESMIDSQEYYNNKNNRTINNKTVYPNNYEYSNIRTWLNNSFQNTAFTASEQKAIVPTALDNSAYSDSQYDSNFTTDNIWLLSYSKVLNSDYGFTTDSNETDTRQAQGTDYSRTQGLFENDYCYPGWWLRTAGTTDLSAGFVDKNGQVWSSLGFNYTYDTGNGVRPALTINLEADVFSKCEHSIVTDKTVAATCTKTGLTEGSHCSVCNTLFTEQKTVAALGHDFTGTAHTNADGSISYKCTRCNEYGGTVMPTEKKLDEITGTKRLTKDNVDILVAPVEMTVGTVLTSANGATMADKNNNTISDTKTPLATGMKVILGKTSVTISVAGDVDGSGEINVSDARLALRAAVKLDTLTGTNFTSADVDFSGDISVSDARLILRAAVKLDDPKKVWIK